MTTSSDQTPSAAPKRLLLRRRSIQVLLLLLLLAVVRVVWGQYFARVSIGPETTRLIEGDTLPHYAAHIRARYSYGITASNNAAVPLVLAIGPTLLPEAHRRLAAITDNHPEVLTSEGGYFLPLETFLRIHRPRPRATTTRPDDDLYEYSDVLKSEADAYLAPFTRETFPYLADWLRLNQTALARATEASRRPRLFIGFNVDSRSLLMFTYNTLPVGKLYEINQALVYRAMLHLGNSNISDAQSDILTVHRFARLVAQSPFLSDQEFAATLELMALRAGVTLLQAPGNTAADLRAYLGELLALPPLPSLAEPLDYYERYCWLELFTTVALRGQRYVGELQWSAHYNYDEISFSRTSFKAINVLPVNFDSALRRVNHIFDRAVAAEKLATYAERKAACLALREDCTATSRGFSSTYVLLPFDKRVFAANPPFELHDAAPERLEEARVCLDMVRIAFALAAYRQLHGGYPASLGELAPQFLPVIPQDRFADAPFHYRFDGTHADFFLYSVGPNCRDDRGVAAVVPESLTDDLALTADSKLPRVPRHSIISMRGFQ